MKRAALYVRVSSQGQVRDGYSLTFQEEILKEFCQRESLTVAGIYRDGGQSGSTTQRKDLLRLIEDARQRRFDTVLIFRVDRFSRDPLDLLALVRELESKNIKLRSVTESVDAGDPAGELMLTILGAIGKFVRQNIIQNAMLGKTKRAQTGRFTGGKVPFGFKVTEDGTYELDTTPWWNGQTAAEVARLVFTTYLSLAREGGGCGSVATAFNQQGIPGPKTVWATAAIHQMLTNPCYVGDFAYNKRSHQLNKKSKVLSPDEWVVVPDAHAAIVDRATWDQVQQHLKQNRSYGGRRPETGKDLIVGFLRCGECGAALNARRSSKNPQHNYYTCLSRFSERRNRENSACKDFPYIKAHELEELIWGVLLRLAEEQERIETLRNQMCANVAPDIAEAKAEKAKLQKRLETLESQAMTITTDYAEGKLAEYLWQKQLERVEQERVSVQTRLRQAEERLAELETQAPPEANTEEIQQYVREQLAGRTTLEEKREALGILVGHRGIRVYKDGTVDFDVKVPGFVGQVAATAELSAPTRPAHSPRTR